MKAIVATLLVLFGTTALAADRTSEDWNACKKAALAKHESAEVKIKKIRSRNIDMYVTLPDGEKLVLTCFRNDYSIVTK